MPQTNDQKIACPDFSALSCESFAEVLAAKQSVPGGGGAAAYGGALAAALCSMTGNFTVGKPAYAAYEADLQRLLERAEGARMRLVALVNKDAAAFAPLSAAYALPKDTPEALEARAEALEKATLDALRPPLQMMREIAGVIELLEEMGEKGSKLLISDVGCGAALAEGALRAAALNVLINTKSLRNRSFADEVNAECSELLTEYIPRATAVFENVYNQVS